VTRVCPLREYALRSMPSVHDAAHDRAMETDVNPSLLLALLATLWFAAAAPVFVPSLDEEL